MLPVHPQVKEKVGYHIPMGPDIDFCSIIGWGKTPLLSGKIGFRESVGAERVDRTSMITSSHGGINYCFFTPEVCVPSLSRAEPGRVLNVRLEGTEVNGPLQKTFSFLQREITQT